MSARPIVQIIEDHADNADLMTYLLSAFGYEPRVARTGAEGLAAVRRERPAVIVCDIQLPDTDGYAIARELGTDPALHDVPLVAVTALAMVGDRERILAAGFDGYVPKPIDPETFVPQVAALLAPERRAAAASAPASAPGADLPRPDGSPRATVLVADDHVENLALKRSLLEPSGYAVVTVRSMRDALAALEAATPDLIISDVQMAEGSGFEFIGLVKADERWRDIPFLFITSTHANEGSRQRGLALGAVRYLFRPLDPEQVLREIETCLAARKGGTGVSHPRG